MFNSAANYFIFARLFISLLIAYSALAPSTNKVITKCNAFAFLQHFRSFRTQNYDILWIHIDSMAQNKQFKFRNTNGDIVHIWYIRRIYDFSYKRNGKRFSQISAPFSENGKSWNLKLCSFNIYSISVLFAWNCMNKNI